MNHQRFAKSPNFVSSVPIGPRADVGRGKFEASEMTSDPQRIDTNDRWLDNTLSSSIPGHPRWLVARSAVMVVCGIAVLLLILGDRRFVAATALAVAGLMQPVVWLCVPRTNRATAHAFSDFVLIFFIVAIEPDIWAPGLFFAGAILG